MNIVAGALVPVGANPPWSWNLLTDVRDMWSYPFMVNAFRAGTAVAITAALIGWFMVLRKQTFAGHTLSVTAFPGAAAATLLGISATVGYFAFCLGAAAVIAFASRPRGRGFSEESAVVGTVQAFLLACGFLFVYLYKGFLGGVNSPLFGSFLGITDGQVVALVCVGIAVVVTLAVIARPLLFSSIDFDVAAARGVGVRTIGVVFLLLLGAAAAEASQITGALLVFALLVMPAATAQRLTSRPLLSVAVAVAVALAATWAALTTAYYTSYPVGFCLSSFAFGAYVLAALASVPRRLGRRTSSAPSVAEAHP